MNWKPGALIYYLVPILAAVMWFIVRQGTPMFDNYDVATHSLGQLSGLIGMTLFAMSFVLTTRSRWIEDIFGGLDKVYRTHHVSGALAFVFLLFHPLLLVLKFVPGNTKQAAIYLLPSASWAVNFGIIALLGMIVLILLTFYIAIRYQNWKFTHRWMGIVFVIALLHVFMVTTDITFYPPLFYFMLVVSGIGLIAHVHGSYIKRLWHRRARYVVDSVETKGQVTIIGLKPQTRKLDFIAGQFAFLSFKDNKIGPEQHPFTIASSPRNDRLVFVIKTLGDYTATLSTLKKGTIAEIEGPHGEFYRITGAPKRIWIAGGIGITPFVSMMEDIELAGHEPSPTDLYYCTKNKEEAIFLEHFERVSKRYPQVKVISFCADKDGQLNADIVDKRSGLANSDIYICGPPPMMRALSNQMRKKGIPRSKIHMEDFSFK